MGRIAERRMKVSGFTLIELMIVIAILGILAAIAIPQFSLYRTRSFNSAAQADLRNAATGQEAYFLDHDTYCRDTTRLVGSTYMLFLSDGVQLTIVAGSTGASEYVMKARHPSGDRTFTLSGPGGNIE